MYIFSIDTRKHTLIVYHPTPLLTQELINDTVTHSLHKRYYCYIHTSDIPTRDTSVYIDLNRIFTEHELSDIPETISDFLSWLCTDIIIDGYGISNEPYNHTYLPFVQLKDMDMDIRYCDIDNPSKCIPLGISNRGLNDISISCKTQDISAILPIVAGRLRYTIPFEDTLYIPDCGEEFSKDVQLGYIDTTLAGYHRSTPISELTHRHDGYYLYIDLPDDDRYGKKWSTTPIVSICGHIYLPIDTSLHMVNDTTLRVDLRSLLGYNNIFEFSELYETLIEDIHSILITFKRPLLFTISHTQNSSRCNHTVETYTEYDSHFDGIVIDPYMHKVRAYTKLHVDTLYRPTYNRYIHIQDTHTDTYPIHEYDVSTIDPSVSVDLSYLTPHRTERYFKLINFIVQ
jgi:hypothetical protein